MNFLYKGSVDINPARKALEFNKKLFSIHTFRQSHELSPHRGTETIYLRWPKIVEDFSRNVDEALDGMVSIDYPSLQISAFIDLVNAVRDKIDRPIARAIIVKLKPGEHIYEHVDQGAHAEATERYHLPIETNPESFLRVEDQYVFPEVGDIWWFNKHKPHSAANGGDTNRIHLIVDTPR